MPQRLLKPGLLTSLRFNRMSWMAQALYVRLILLADDYGRFDGHPLIVSRAAFPYGDPRGRVLPEVRIEELLAELESSRIRDDELPLVSRYEVGGVPFLVMNRWTERQRARKSRYPAPPFEKMPADDSRNAGNPPNCQQVAGICQQMTADDSRNAQNPPKCQQMTADVRHVLSNDRPHDHDHDHSTGGNNKGGGGGVLERKLRTQFAALREEIKVMEGRVGELTAKECEELRKKRRMLGEIQKKQAAGEF